GCAGRAADPAGTDGPRADPTKSGASRTGAGRAGVAAERGLMRPGILDTEPDMKLYSFFRSGTSHRLRIALNLKGLPYKIEAVDLRTEQHLCAGYRAIHPQ